MKKNIVFILVFSLIARSKADALENAIKESKLNEFIEFFNNSIVAHTLKDDATKQYVELAQEVTSERSNYLLNRFDKYDIARIALGAILTVLGTEAFEIALKGLRDHNGVKIQVHTAYHVGLATLGIVCAGLGLDQFYQGWIKADRHEKYKNALAIQTILQPNQITLSHQETV